MTMQHLVVSTIEYRGRHVLRMFFLQQFSSLYSNNVGGEFFASYNGRVINNLLTSYHGSVSEVGKITWIKLLFPSFPLSSYFDFRFDKNVRSRGWWCLSSPSMSFYTHTKRQRPWMHFSRSIPIKSPHSICSSYEVREFWCHFLWHVASKKCFGCGIYSCNSTATEQLLDTLFWGEAS